MKVVADTNIFLAVVLDEPEKNWVIDVTAKTDALAPEVLPFEIANAISAMVKRRRLTEREALLALGQVGEISVRLLSVDTKASLKLAIEHNIYAYDAFFIQCARSMSCPLVTLDKRMKQVALALDIEVLE